MSKNLAEALLVLLCGLMVSLLYYLVGFEVTVLSCIAFIIFKQVSERAKWQFTFCLNLYTII